jgi:hypothetical protein
MEIIIEEQEQEQKEQFLYSESSSKDRNDRNEMLWNNRLETLFIHWAMECKENAKQHNNEAKRKKLLYRCFGIPAVIIPITMASANQLMGEDSYHSKLINSIGYLLTGALTAVNTFINYAAQYEKHYSAEVRYMELHTDIESILIKCKKDRQAADIVLERYKLKIEHVNEYAPDI